MTTTSPPTPKEFAQLLLAYEASLSKPAGAKVSPAGCVFEKMRGPLGKLMGVGGFRSLLLRALTLASADIPSLRSLQIQADGSLSGLEELEPQFDARMVAEGEAALVAELLGLLVIFIGPALTQRLLRDIWPKMADLNP